MEATQVICPIPEPIVRTLARWNSAFWIWRFNHYFWGIAAIVCGLAAGSKLSLLTLPPDVSLRFFGFAAAACSGIVTFLPAAAKALNYGRACDHLSATCTKYQLDASLTNAALTEALDKGQSLIDGSEKL
jgi:hypothetical protein